MTLENRKNKIIIRFYDCKFTYSSLDFGFPDDIGIGSNRRSKGILDKIFSSRGAIFEETCSFNLTDKETITQMFEKISSVSSVQFSFHNSKFVHRKTSTTEKMSNALRKVFGIIFVLDKTAPSFSAIDVENYTFRLKDVPKVASDYLLSRIEKYN